MLRNELSIISKVVSSCYLLTISMASMASLSNLVAADDHVDSAKLLIKQGPKQVLPAIVVLAALFPTSNS